MIRSRIKSLGRLAQTLNNKGPSGVLNIAGYSLSLENIEHNNSSEAKVFRGTFDSEEFLEEYQGEKYPLSLQLIALDDPRRFAGVLRRPSGQWGSLGFYLIPRKDFSYEDSVDTFSSIDKWEESSLTFAVPSEGLPTDSGSKRLINGLNNKEVDRGEVTTKHNSGSRSNAVNQDYVQCGVLGEKPWFDRGGDRTDCSDRDPTWNLVTGITGRGTGKEEYYQIEAGQSGMWEAHIYFSDRPDDHLIGDRCSSSTTPPYGRPFGFEFEIQIGEDEVRDDLYFTDPEPQDGDGGSSNSQLNRLFSFVDSIHGNLLTSMATAATGYDQNGSAQVERSSQGDEINFYIPMDPYNDNLPTGGEDGDISNVRFRVNNEYDSGTHSVIMYPRFALSIMGTPGGSFIQGISESRGRCFCDYTNPLLIHSTPQQPLEVEYQAIS
ncbi:hypothetical protein AB7C87_11325 [Natrarchaeobius sp. A-rgal3]|uniref:hypothetical protein n=1 Tax=Natrarchaeobius versutus TaxID=1679078 RepID=UPI0035106BC0